ncbi:MAG: hypothetical protein AB1704_00315 [Pseudomonadota bacterium]|uniref:hypothetical protein n=1 Tax=Burkholderiaceae TaxID=119060 RepID=UPI002016E9D2|nr:hypothetical protein [Burkholderia sp. 4M9327F10]
MSNRASDLRPMITAKHPFENCFVDLGSHSADKALIALTDAVHAEQRDMNAYDWITQALPGATLKPALAFGTVGELYRSYTRPAEFGRLKEVWRS